MKTASISARLVVLAFGTALTGALPADVSITELDDCLRVQIDGQTFTEWRHKDWAAPYLYPVIGSNGENITRHFPMRRGVPSEEPDHSHHRSIRFSHSDVNGFNFWWAAGKDQAGHTAEVKLERIERIASGRTGEVILWNQWLGDGRLVLREKVRLAFIPLENRQLLMDYDVELCAGDRAVTLGDKRDGGLLVRVAGTMKVENEQGQRFEGAIRNSRGEQNADVWGKPAEWIDYYGPDASGRTVGIAMFDHPANVRFPTPWHARTYGLMTANRFGTDHFRAHYDDHKTVSCRPFGDACAACASHSGDYTIAAGTSLVLRHRLYFHHGDPEAAGVADRYREYTADSDSAVARMRVLHADRRWRELIEQFEREDFAAWPAAGAGKASEAFHLRGQAHAYLKNGKAAEADFRAALTGNPQNALIWLSLADNYAVNLRDEPQALAAYRQVLAIAGRPNGWLPISATLAIARILTDGVKTAEALEVLTAYGDMDDMAPVWRLKMLRAYGHVYAAAGRERESLASFREALQLELRGESGPTTPPRSRNGLPLDDTPSPDSSRSEKPVRRSPPDGAAEAAQFHAGTAKVDITPSEQAAVNLVGQPLRLRDPLYARVLVIKDQDLAVAIVSLDLIVFASQKVIAEAKSRWGVDHVILCATHTHAGMAPRGLIIKPPDAPDWTRNGNDPADSIDWPGLSADPWYAATEEKIVAAIGQAMQNLFAARIVAGKGRLESAYLAHNRRLVRDDGRVLAMWDNPDRRPTQPVDPTLGVIRVDDQSGRTRALAVHYACHPVALMGAGVVSRDFPGAMVDYVEQELGDECLAMYLQGAQGDIDPYDLHNLGGENRFNIVRQAGISLGKGALRVAANLNAPQGTTRPALQVRESLLTIPHRQGDRTTDVGLLTVVVAGHLALVTIPGEPFIQHQLDLTAGAPIANAFILGLAYHGKGTPFAVYIPTSQAVKEGGYGAAECSFLAADAGEQMVRDAVTGIRDLMRQSNVSPVKTPAKTD